MKTMRFIGIWAVALVLLASSVVMAAGASWQQEPLRYIHESGLTVLQAERDNLPMVQVTLMIKAGSMQEPPEKAGVASMTASLLTEGTTSRSSKEISEEVEFLGASLGASASEEFTTLSLSVLKKDVDKGFELLADVLLNPAFKGKELKRKKEQVLGALRQKNEEPGYIASLRLDELVYGGHPYGRPVIGTPGSVKAIKGPDVRDYYKRWYHPDNAIVSVVGMLTPDELRALIDKHLGGWEPTAEDAASAAPIEPPLSSTEMLLRVDRDITQANIMMGHLGVRRSNPDYYALQVMNYVLGGGGFSSRLMDRLRDQLGLTYGIYSRFSAQKDAGAFYISIQTRNDAAAECLREIRTIVEDVIKNGVTADELAGAKAYMTGSFPRRIDTMSEMSSFLAAVEFYELGLDYPATYARKIDEVSLEEVRRVAAEHLMPDKLITVVVGNMEKVGELGQ